MSADAELKAYYEIFKVIPTLREAEEKALLKKVKRGDMKAYQEFISANVRLVISRALRFCARDDPRIMDLISDGTLGLIRAVEQFDCKRNYRFSTYAVWWIDSYIRKSIRFFQKETHATIQNLRKKFKFAETVMVAATGETPSDEEVARYLKWPPYLLQIYLKYSDPKIKISHDPLVIDTAEAQDGDPEEIPIQKDAAKAVAIILARLAPVEEDVLRRHYGIGCKEETYKDIAVFYGFAKERVRQIENQALRKLFVLLKEKEIPFEFLMKPEGDDSEDFPF
jgi:RNA polymerase sigma factor (sigma-70 family)